MKLFCFLRSFRSFLPNFEQIPFLVFIYLLYNKNIRKTLFRGVSLPRELRIARHKVVLVSMMFFLFFIQNRRSAIYYFAHLIEIKIKTERAPAKQLGFSAHKYLRIHTRYINIANLREWDLVLHFFPQLPYFIKDSII